jgi:peptidase E
VTGHILAIGGGDGFLGLMLSLAEKPRPRLCYLPTAVADDPARIVAFYEGVRGLDCDPYHVKLFGIPEGCAEQVASADVVLVAGGNTANMLAIWRLHGIDRALREVWARGGVLGGASAGANCWFEGCVTDSFSAELDPLADGLGFLTGSFCPHYDGEELRRPAFTRFVADGALAPGLACDDFAAALYRGRDLVEVVAAREGAGAYRVTPGGEEPLPARVLPG